LLAALAQPAPAAPVLLRPQYTVQATIAPGAPQIDGTVVVEFTNRSQRTLREAVFFLFPHRFSEPDADINDFNRPYVYPEQEFDPGAMRLLDVRDAGASTHAVPVAHPHLPAGTIVRVPIADLAPGATRTLSLAFTVTVPHRFGSFGEFDGQLTMVGGWYPYLADLDASGLWAIDAGPPLADFDVTLTPAPGLEMLLNGRYIGPGAPPTHFVVPSVHYLSLIAAPRFLRDETSAGGTRIVFFHRPPSRLSTRIATGPSPTEAVLATLRDIVVLRPAAVPAPGPELVVVEAPLRLNLTAPGEGDVVVSDRLLKLSPVLRPFHELQLAQAVYAELLRPSLAPRESARDYAWVSEGVSHTLADRYMSQVEPTRRSVYDWIELFNVFAVVDRFESSPKIPFTAAFFHRAKDADPMHGEILTFNQTAPPGRVVLSKLREQLGGAEFDVLLDSCLQTPAPLRECSADNVQEYDVTGLLAQWTAPYPAIDYRVEETDFNQRENGHYRSTVTVRRVSSRPFQEPVTLRLKTLGGADVDLKWKSGGDVAIMTAATPDRVYQAVIDPDRKLIDDKRSNNAWPPRPQVVLDSADIAISSTEFGFSALVVARARYDYRRDLAAVGFYTNRGIGFTVGGRLHWGTPVDNSRYRNNLYAFYLFEALDSGFKQKSNCPPNAGPPCARTTGQRAGLGLRYDYDNVYWRDNPSDQRRLRLFVDWYDKNLGSDYGYLDWGYVASGTVPLGTPRWIAAGQLFNGFSHAFNSLVPNQGLYSLGGSNSIRGIGAEEQLARNIVVLRTELRYEIYPELDLNLLDFLVLRRTQVHLLLDTGNVSNSAGRIYDVGQWAAGIGGGVGLLYELFGFFPASAYFEIATRIDDPSEAGDVQFLFGSTQAF
jgi:hypothetical protein